jgi:replicative DNA helicase
VDTIDFYLSTPEMGIPLSFEGFNELFRGFLQSNVIFSGMRSNLGKSRLLTMIAADVVIRQNKRMMIISNEMTESAIKNCLIVTVINNKIFQEMHGIDIKKNEKELTLGLYRDDKTGEFVTRKKDKQTGEFVETEEEYISRIKETTEYKKVNAVATWLENKTRGKLYFHDVTSDYSQEAIELEIRKSKVIYKCDIFAVDTLKVDKLESWDRLKMLATKIVEVAKEINMCGYATFQLTDATVYDDIFSLSSNNISGAKGIKHPVDVMLLNEEIKKEDFDKYQYMPFESSDSLMWGEPVPMELNKDKRYLAGVVDKNRKGEKCILLFEFDLNFNTWLNVGKLIKKI